MNGIEIVTGDFRQLSDDDLADGSVDAIVTDPPYPKEYLSLWADLGQVAARVLKPSGYLMTYSGQIWLDRVFAMLGEHLSYYTMIVNAEPGSHGRINARAMFQEWKPILVYQKPPMARRNGWGPNVVVSPSPSKNFHKWGQNLGPVRELIERFSEPGDLVWDPMIGGGTTAVACLQTNRRCIGYEIDPVAADVARDRVANAQLPLFVPEPVAQLALPDEWPAGAN